MKNNKKKKLNLVDWMDLHVFTKKTLLLLIVLFVTYQFTQIIYSGYQLRKYGLETMGFVYGLHGGTTGADFYSYRFYASESREYYSGKTLCETNVGDSIRVVYLPSNPKINRPVKDLHFFNR